MDTTSRERRLTATFVALADTLVDDYDVVELLQGLVETSAAVLDAAAAGLVLADDHGELSLIASTSEDTRLVDLLQLQSGSGPSVEAFETGKVVVVPDIEFDARWPDFRAAALAQHFHGIHSIPLRLRSTVIGTLSLFLTPAGVLNDDDAAAAQGLADVAAIGILNERIVREHGLAREQLQRALSSRVVIEQAKGVIAQLHDADMDEAFVILREHARSHRMPLHEVAALVVSRQLSL